MRALFWNIAYTSGAQGYSLVVGIVAVTVTARWLGPEGRGTIAAVTTWVGLFSTIGCLSLGQVAIHRATQLRDQAWLGATLGSLLLVDVIITLVGWLSTLVLYLMTAGAAFSMLSPIFLAVGFLSLPFLIWEQYGSSLLMAVDRVTIYNRAQILGRTAGLALVFVAWWLNLGVLGVLVATVVSQAVLALFGVSFLFESSQQPVRPDKSTIRALLKGAAKLHLNNVGGFLVTSAGVLIISHYQSATETGYYQVAAQLTNVLTVIPLAASMVIYGKVTQLGPDAAWGYQRKMVAILMLGMLGTTAVAALLAPWLIPLALGIRFAPSVGIFQILLLGVLAGTLATLMGSQWIGRGLFLYMSGSTILLGILNVAANLFLVPRFGVYGAAWAFVGIYVLAALVQVWMVIQCETKYRDSLPAYKPT